MKKNILLTLTILIIALSFSSCKNEKKNTIRKVWEVENFDISAIMPEEVPEEISENAVLIVDLSKTDGIQIGINVPFLGNTAFYIEELDLMLQNFDFTVEEISDTEGNIKMASKIIPTGPIVAASYKNLTKNTVVFTISNNLKKYLGEISQLNYNAKSSDREFTWQKLNLSDMIQ